MEYNEMINRIEKILEIAKFGVLATASKDGIVAASQMCIVSDGLKVYFQTDSTFEKVRNIKENQNVAINVGKYYFKGIAIILGHPTSNSLFVEKIKEKHIETYNSYTNLPSEVLIEVILTECKIWGLEKNDDIHNEDVIQVIDIKNKKLNKIVCKKM